MSTPHNQAAKGEIAKNVLMPGDPLRAKFIAETFLQDARLVNEVRNMYAYTGYYKEKPITVMASGMGMPSMGIYSYELFSLYDVEQIIRIGSAGAYTSELHLKDVVLAESVWSETSFAKTQNGCDADIMLPSRELNDKIQDASERLNIPVKKVRVHSSDVFYCESNVDDYREINRKYQCACVDMESFALFHNAGVWHKKAACLLTISDSFPMGEKATAQERQTAFTDMMKVALEASI
jgi:purine-nucleoside phosphorylase